MIYCCSASGSDIEKASVPVPISVPVPAPVPAPDPDFTKHSFSKTFVQNLAFLLLEAALFLRKLASHFDF